MAIVKREWLPADGTAWVSWFNSLGCSLISGSGTTISIDGLFTIDKVAGTNELTIQYDQRYLVYQEVTSPCKVTVCCSDTLFYFFCQGPDAAPSRTIFIYEKLPQDSFYGYSSLDGSSQFIAINDVYLTSMTVGGSYAHKARLYFTSQLGEICFTSDALFKDNVRDISDPNFISCSTVGADQIYSFNLGDFYAVGCNTLVRIDLD